MASIFKVSNALNIVNNFLKPRIHITQVRTKSHLNPKPKKRYPPWLPKQHRVPYNEEITPSNTKFIQDVIKDKFGPRQIGIGMPPSPLKIEPIEPVTTRKQESCRTGVIAKKIGIYPMWLKNGKKVSATLLQVLDNHVIKYIPPENFNPRIGSKKYQLPKRRKGCLVVGAESTDPQKFTKEYCGMFNEAGVMPKKILARFMITDDAALQPGTPLYAAHFRAGDYVDIRGKTVDRGFQGVMKRWGFHGQPATHGQTKTHRRPGNIGSGGALARVMPGTKLPGHMGNSYRILRGVKILRVNTKYNILWVYAQNLPGETNNFLQIYDTILPKKDIKNLHFPTYIPDSEESLPEEMLADDVHPFAAPSIEIKET